MTDRYIHPSDERLVQGAFRSGLYRFRMWQRGRADELKGVDDCDLLRCTDLEGVWLNVTELPPNLSSEDAAAGGWKYLMEELPTSGDGVLLATVYAPVIEIAAACLSTRNPQALVAYATVFWAHTAIHNILHGIVGPGDTHDLARLVSDGQADHLSRIIGLEAYGIDFERDPRGDVDRAMLPKVLSGTAIPMFQERARRRGLAEREQRGRAPRRAWRDLSERLILGGLPADGVSVVPGDDHIHVSVGGLVRSFRAASLADAPALAYATYAGHLDRGALVSEHRRLRAALDAVKIER